MTHEYTDLELMTWRPAYNVGSAVINPREVCRVAAGDDLRNSMVGVTQPDATAGQTYCVNGPMSIKSGGYGKVCFGPVVLVAYESGSPVLDEQWGWKASQGTVVKGSNPLFRVLRIVNPTAKLLLGSTIPSIALRFGHLAAELLSTDANGVDTHCDDGGTITNTIYPPSWPTGHLDANARVLVGYCDGKPTVIISPC
jgi:hypothetical protein